MNRFQWIPITGLLATMAAAVYMVVQLSAQGTSVQAGDYRNASVAEVRDAHGQVVLRGPFELVEEDDDDTECKAALEAAGPDADASGEAEVEYSKANPAEQEVEFSIRNLEPAASYSLVIDGAPLGMVQTDQKGRAEFDLDVKAPASR
jgi:hypothetical protein